MALDPFIAAAVFGSAFILDLLYTRYTYYVISLNAEMAGMLSVVWHLLAAGAVVQYAKDPIYIAFVCLGGGLGTYITIYMKRRAAMRQAVATP